MADRRIKLQWSTSRFVLNQIDGIRVRIDILCASDVTQYVFAYRNLPTDPTTGAKDGWFSHICSPSDLAEFPLNAPVPGHQPEWFRLNYADVWLRSREEASAFIEDVRDDVQRLVSTLNIMDTIEPEGVDAIGGPLICGSSSSSLSSESSSSEAPLAYSGQIITRWGTFEQGVGVGLEWDPTGEGAGSPVGSSDSMAGSLPYSYSTVRLLPGMVSQMLLIQGFNFAVLADGDRIDGFTVRLLARWRGGDSSASSLSSESPVGCDQGGGIAWSHEGGPRLFFLTLYHPDLGPVGDERSNNATIYGPDWAELTFGGSGDLWNANLTVADLKRGGFGVALVVGHFSEDPQYIVDVDGIELVLNYGELL